MWISKEHYDELKMYEGHVSVLNQRINHQYELLRDLRLELDEYKEMCKQKTEEINLYKEKYANEVQKRLALIEQISEG